jgi:hypothetical protein
MKFQPQNDWPFSCREVSGALRLHSRCAIHQQQDKNTQEQQHQKKQTEEAPLKQSQID